ncbi:MAG: 50S ribosomal protein L3 [Methanomassiliicoccales archaeon]|nr:MAG: 50S ribosomal protein L3 [Methanomassiliicoccales archaeon]
MPRRTRPRHGSMGYSPRKRATSQVPKFNSWPQTDDGPRIQGFAGYKAGMTHASVVDYRKSSTTAGQSIQVPVTVIEVPPMKIAGVRFYKNSPYGLNTHSEIWAPKPDEALRKRFPIPKSSSKDAWKKIKPEDIDDVRLITHTQPALVTGVPKKAPEIMEIRIGGGSVEERIKYAKKHLGKTIKVSDFTSEGKFVDVAAITRGKGFGGPVKRWGVKLLSHKNSKHRRQAGTIGSFSPGYTRPTAPLAGQIGYHQRTEHNKRVLRIGEKGEDVNPAGGFLHYGLVRNGYIILHGSVPGPAKRLIRLRDASRATVPDVEPEDVKLTYLSTQSKQGA